MNRQSILISKIINACRKAGTAVIRDFGELSKISIQNKGLYDFVSSADKKSEKILAYELQQIRPEYHFLMEESGYVKTTDYTKALVDRCIYRWVIDPIDGTTNFLRGNPNFVICVSLEKVDIPDFINSDDMLEDYMANHKIPSDVIAGVIYLPFHREFYWAEKTLGAFHIDDNNNQSKISIKPKQDLGGLVVNTLLHEDRIFAFDNVFQFLSNEKARWRVSGSIALDMVYLANNKNDVVIFAEKLKPWDISAASLIAKEAGAKIVNLDLKHIANVSHMIDGMIAGHPSIINKLIDALNDKKIS